MKNLSERDKIVNELKNTNHPGAFMDYGEIVDFIIKDRARIVSPLVIKLKDMKNLGFSDLLRATKETLRNAGVTNEQG